MTECEFSRLQVSAADSRPVLFLGAAADADLLCRGFTVATSPRILTQPESSPAEPLLSSLQTAWSQLSECTDLVGQAFASARNAPGDSPNVKEMRDWYDDTTRRLLTQPVQQCLSFQPVHRALEAIELSDRENKRKFLHRRAHTHTRFLWLFTLTALDLCEPWRIWRSGSRQQQWNAWEQRRQRRIKAAEILLSRYAKWVQQETPSAGSPEVRPREKLRDAWQRRLSALSATLEAELAQRELTLLWFDMTLGYAMDAQHEREAVESYADATLAWLVQEDQFGVSAETLALVAPEDRLRAWSLPIEAEGSHTLPERVELLAGDRFGTRMRIVAPRASFLKAFERYARKPMRAIIDGVWKNTAETLVEVEHAKEVVAYWSETSKDRAETTVELIADARNNAVAALRTCLQAPPPTHRLEADARAAFWTWHTQGCISVEADLYGWLPLIDQARWSVFLEIAAETIRLKSQAMLQGTGKWVSRRVDLIMESIGGRVPSQPSLPPVVRRTTLRDTLSLPATKTDLPVLYGLLFRVAPVEDRRFLVGRTQELAGLEQAVVDWEAGRFAACLLIGARGSGKTSLLNCATHDIFSRHHWLRAEFYERILTPENLDGFLRDLLKLDNDTDLETAFRAERRVLILEEAERLFLRKVGGFDAARYLAHLIHHTASTTLWIIVMNDRSFRVVDAATQLHRVFSHRINAMNVSRADLEKAILERHRLSGLRLDFAPPPPSDPRMSRAKSMFGLEASPQKLFFDSLFQQSEGIFRSALQLWLSSLERVEGQTLKVRQPLDPAFSRFRSEFAEEDKFTLLVIQEHGSLTEAELAEVLCESREHSRSRMERLSALGLLDPDHEHPGLRVNPEAQRFVNNLLRGTNLT